MTAPDSPGGDTRLRFPGGRLRPTDWTSLAQLATAHSSGLHLTSRGHIALQGAWDEALLREHVEAGRLAHAAVHVRARTVLASPMAGRLPGHHDLADLPERLAAALLARADAASISADFQFGFDDGSGDVLAHGADLTAVAGPGDGLVRLHVSGRDTGLATPMAEAESVLVDAAVGFAASADGLWRVPAAGELHDLVVVALSGHPLTSRYDTTPGDSPSTSVRGSAAAVPPVGWVDTSDGLVTLLAVVPRGLVPARLAEFLGAIERPSTISADRVIGVHGLTESMAEQVVRVLAPMGMIFDAESPWVTGSA